MGKLNARTRDAALRLYRGFTIRKVSFRALCDRGLAHTIDAKQQLTDAGRHFILTGVIPN